MLGRTSLPSSAWQRAAPPDRKARGRRTSYPWPIGREADRRKSASFALSASRPYRPPSRSGSFLETRHRHQRPPARQSWVGEPSDGVRAYSGQLRTAGALARSPLCTAAKACRCCVLRMARFENRIVDRSSAGDLDHVIKDRDPDKAGNSLPIVPSLSPPRMPRTDRGFRARTNCECRTSWLFALFCLHRAYQSRASGYAKPASSPTTHITWSRMMRAGPTNASQRKFLHQAAVLRDFRGRNSEAETAGLCPPSLSPIARRAGSGSIR